MERAVIPPLRSAGWRIGVTPDHTARWKPGIHEILSQNKNKNERLRAEAAPRWGPCVRAGDSRFSGQDTKGGWCLTTYL